jgi:ribosomal biogenesis protein LAS1
VPKVMPHRPLIIQLIYDHCLQVWMDQDMAIMKDRLAQTQSMTAKQVEPVPQSESGMACGDAIEAVRMGMLPTGWQKLNSTSWRPCPIGVFHKPSTAPA